MKVLLVSLLLLICLGFQANAQTVEIELTSPGMYKDADGWQPFKPAFNLMPIAGVTFVGTGIFNLVKENTTAGWLQIAIGSGLVVLGFFIGGR